MGWKLEIIPYLFGVINLAVYHFDLIPKWGIELIFFVLLIVWGINIFWLGNKLDLIKKYSSLMKKHLDNLSSVNGKSNQIITKTITSLKNLDNDYSLWNICFESKQRDINKQFYKLHTTLDNLKSFPYYLLWANETQINNEFIALVRDTKIMYEDFAQIVNSKRIFVAESDCIIIKNMYEDLTHALKDFDEIKIPQELLSCPLLPQPDLYIV